MAISIDPAEKSRELAAKIAADGQGAVAFRLLSDPGAKTIDAWGLRDPTYAGQRIDGVPHPAVYVIDAEGKVRWSKIESDYRERPANAEVRAALDALGRP